MKLIVLKPKQAKKISGLSSDGCASLDPRKTASGDFVIPARVLLDPAHKSHHDYLSGLPQMEASEIDFPIAKEY